MSARRLMNLISLYTAQATANGGRADGTVQTADGAINLRRALPTHSVSSLVSTTAF